MLKLNIRAMRLRFIFCTLLLFVALISYGQSYAEDYLYGKWRILGSFRDGEQTLPALKDTIRNPIHYYFYFNADGTYTSDVVSLKRGYKGEIMKGKWLLDTTNMVIAKIRVLDRKEMRNIPKRWIRQDEDGTFTIVPVTYPIVELSRKKLVLYDKQHNTYDIYIK